MMIRRRKRNCSEFSKFETTSAASFKSYGEVRTAVNISGNLHRIRWISLITQCDKDGRAVKWQMQFSLPVHPRWTRSEIKFIRRNPPPKSGGTRQIEWPVGGKRKRKNHGADLGPSRWCWWLRFKWGPLASIPQPTWPFRIGARGRPVPSSFLLYIYLKGRTRTSRTSRRRTK